MQPVVFMHTSHANLSHEPATVELPAGIIAVVSLPAAGAAVVDVAAAVEVVVEVLWHEANATRAAIIKRENIIV